MNEIYKARWKTVGTLLFQKLESFGKARSQLPGYKNPARLANFELTF